MVRLNGALCRASIFVGLLAVLSAPASTQQKPVRTVALDRIDRGLWELRDLAKPDARHPPICLGSPYRLVQIRHQRPGCTRTIVARDPMGVTVHYTCPGADYGHTVLRLETPRLVQVDTQGIADGRPFAIRAEARRVGNCTPVGKGGR